MLCPNQPREFASRKNDIHVRYSVLPSASCTVHIRQRRFSLLGYAGHDGNTADLLRTYAELLCEIGLCHRSEHLLRRLGSGKITRQLRVLGFHKTHPGRAARGEHGPSLLLRIRQSGQQFASLFHDGQIRGKIRVKNIVEADLLQRGHHPSFGSHMGRKAQRLTPGGPDRRCDLYDRNDLRICQNFENFPCIVPFPKRPRRTMRNALSADAAVRFLYGSVAGYIHRGSGTGILYVPDVKRLHLIADLHAAHAFDAFPKIPDQRKILVPGHFHDFLLIRNIYDSQIVRQLLQVTVSASYTGGAVAVVLGQDQFHIGPAHRTHFRGIGVQHHPFLHRIVAGSDQLYFPLHLHHADLARADFIDPFQIAQMRDHDPCGCSRLHDRCTFRHADPFVVNR